MSDWVVSEFGSDPIELAVLRQSNAHGKRSFGWSHPDRKWIIAVMSASPGPIGQKLNDLHRKTAANLCDFLNKKEKSPTA